MPETSHPSVGVGVLLTDNQGRVLLTLRKRPPEAGCWSIVGGKVDFLETLEQCAIREAREEVGVEISLRSLLCVTSHRLRREPALGLPRLSRPNPFGRSHQLRARQNMRGPLVCP